VRLVALNAGCPRRKGVGRRRVVETVQELVEQTRFFLGRGMAVILERVGDAAQQIRA
jgi:hypothetical protein